MRVVVFKDLEAYRIHKGNHVSRYLITRKRELPVLDLNAYSYTYQQLHEVRVASALSTIECVFRQTLTELCVSGNKFLWRPVDANDIVRRMQKDELVLRHANWWGQLEAVLTDLTLDKKIRMVKRRRHTFIIPSPEFALVLQATALRA